MSQEVRGGVSSERLHMLPGANIFSVESEEERWNLKEDPYMASRRGLEESKKRPSPIRGTGKLALMLLEWVMKGSEGSLPTPDFTTASGVEDSSIEKSEKAAAAQTVPEQPTKAQAGSPRPVWRLGDLLLRRSSQGPEKVSATSSTDSSKKPAAYSEETYVEAYDEQGRLYHKRVAVE